MKNKIFLLLCFWLTGTSLVLSQSDTANNKLYRAFPKIRMENLVREEITRNLQEKGIKGPELLSRVSANTHVITDSIYSRILKKPDLLKLLEEYSVPKKIKNAARPTERVEAAIRKLIPEILKSNPYQWRYLYARDYSDRILIFHDDIEVLTSGKIKVVETITVYNGDGEESPDIDYATSMSPNNDIKRGIVRDFPTRYIREDGLWELVGFDLKRVTQNGQSANYKTESLDNGIRILIGEAERLLNTGIYTYTIEYETNRQLIFHPQKTELYWNVNGTGWVFSADSISATVHFPSGSNILENDCYSGFQGSTDKHCTSSILDNHTIRFYSTQRMESYEGLTIAVSIQPGIIKDPGPTTLLEKAKANWGIGILGLACILLFSFYFFIWYKKGRDPKKGTIIPQFEPPANLSPADVGYIIKQKFGTHLFAAAVVDMAVKNLLKIEVTTKKFILKSTSYRFINPNPKKSNEGSHLQNIYGFSPGRLYGEVAERGNYNPTLKSAQESLKQKLEERFKIRSGQKNTWVGLFMLNVGYIALGTIILVASLIAGILFLANYYTSSIAIYTVALIACLLAIQFVFARIMSAYTTKGRQIADEIEGFKMYLEMTEQKIFEYLTPPEKTLELFEKYLPYAIALGVENSWGKKFDSIVEKALQEGYQPAYYSGSDSTSFGRSFNMSDMSHGISSGLSSTVSSASTPPSSSSSGGSSGGGSSGGGGGGGGGGGW